MRLKTVKQQTQVIVNTTVFEVDYRIDNGDWKLQVFPNS